MARGRMLATTIADDKRFNALPVDAALVYLMAIPQLDRDGLILGEPVLLWGQVCRRRNDLMPHLADIIAAWVSSGLVTAYKTDDDDTVLHFVGFQKNQAMTHYGREAASRFPCPPGFIRTNKGLIPDSIQPSVDEPSEQLRTNSGLTPDEVLPNINKCNTNKTNVATDATNDGGSSSFSPDDPPLDKKVAAMATAVEANGFGTLTPLMSEEIAEMAKEYPLSWIGDAFRVAVKANKRKLSYVSGVLNNWKRDGYDPKAQIVQSNGQPVTVDIAM